jgi:hypothetical protein
VLRSRCAHEEQRCFRWASRPASGGLGLVGGPVPARMTISEHHCRVHKSSAFHEQPNAHPVSQTTKSGRRRCRHCCCRRSYTFKRIAGQGARRAICFGLGHARRVPLGVAAVAVDPADGVDAGAAPGRELLSAAAFALRAAIATAAAAAATYQPSRRWRLGSSSSGNRFSSRSLSRCWQVRTRAPPAEARCLGGRS